MKTSADVQVDHIETPLGVFAAISNSRDQLVAAGFTEAHARMEELLERYATGGAGALPRARGPSSARRAIERYFAGEPEALDALRVAPAGSAFQGLVWRALRRIPHGATVSYGELARSIGRPSAARAVGMANRNNPISIVIPCHRVIGADGSLTGYAGGIERKRWLLAHEQASDGHSPRARRSGARAAEVALDERRR